MKALLERKAQISKGIDLWLTELESQIEPNNEEAHNALDRLKDYLTDYDLYVDEVEGKLENVREVVASGKGEAA